MEALAAGMSQHGSPNREFSRACVIECKIHGIRCECECECESKFFVGVLWDAKLSEWRLRDHMMGTG